MAGQNEKKLTPSISQGMIERTERLARRWATSVSGLVEEGLPGLIESPTEDPPLVAELRGCLPEEADRNEHREHLRRKHGA